MQAIHRTRYAFPGQTAFYRGKVRDVYTIEGDLLVVVATDRISAFDHILPKSIPYKGQVLNRISAQFLRATEDIVSNWLIAVPHPNVAIGHKCVPIKIEMVIRGYLAGHAWRVYQSGKRHLCGVQMPDGMQESDPFPEPIITPATKAESGHDEDISADEILEQGIVTPTEWRFLTETTRKLFERGTRMARERGLILVDTKYEFGKHGENIILIDEIHTPDSSRYYYLDGYEQRQSSGEHQKQLSKEFVREWLMAHGFQGKEGQKMPVMPDDFVETVSNRYIKLFEIMTGTRFKKRSVGDPAAEIETKVIEYLNLQKQM